MHELFLLINDDREEPQWTVRHGAQLLILGAGSITEYEHSATIRQGRLYARPNEPCRCRRDSKRLRRLPHVHGKVGD